MTYDFALDTLTKGSTRQAAALDVARIALSLALAAPAGVPPAGVFRSTFAARSHHASAIARFLEGEYVPAREKAAVLPVTIGNAALLPDPLIGVLIEHMAPFGVVDRLGAVTVPFRGKVPTAQIDALPAHRHDEGAWKPASQDLIAATSVELGATTALVVISQELARRPGAERFVLDRLTRAVARRTDVAFVADALAAVASPIASSGTLAADVAAVFEAYLGVDGAPEALVLVLGTEAAIHARLRWPELCRDLGPSGGTLGGVRVVCSAAVGDVLLAVDAGMLLLASEAIAMTASREATVTMDDGGGTAAPDPINLWERNLLGLLVERQINWTFAGDHVAAVTGVSYAPTT